MSRQTAPRSFPSPTQQRQAVFFALAVLCVVSHPYNRKEKDSLASVSHLQTVLRTLMNQDELESQLMGNIGRALLADDDPPLSPRVQAGLAGVFSSGCVGLMA